MAAEMFATPDLATATVLIEATVDATLSLTEVFSQDSAAIYADNVTWSGWSSKTPFSAHMIFRTSAATGSINRVVTGLTVGRTYFFEVTIDKDATARPYSAGGVSGTLPLGTGVSIHQVSFTAATTTATLTLGTVANFTSQIRKIRLMMLPAAGVTTYRLMRTDANGVRAVRLMDGQTVVDGSLVVEDAEAALTGAITYTLTSSTGAYLSASTTLAGVQGYRLVPAPFPQFSSTLDMVTGYDASRPTSTVVHEVIGRTDPVARITPLKTRRGSLTIWCSQYASMQTALDVYRRGEIVFLRQPDYPGLDMYHVALGVRETGYDEQHKRWQLTVDFVETAPPTGPLLGAAGWTWDDLAAAFPTWSQVQSYFETWNAAQIGLNS